MPTRGLNDGHISKKKECTLVIIRTTNTELAAQKHFLTKFARFCFHVLLNASEYLQGEHNFSPQ